MIHPMLLIAGLFAIQEARASNVQCVDSANSVKLNVTVAKNNTAARVEIISDGKSKVIDAKNISRFIRDAKVFYVLFKVPTKAGLHEIELNTRFRTAKTSAGQIINKTQDERLNVNCIF